MTQAEQAGKHGGQNGGWRCGLCSAVSGRNADDGPGGVPKKVIRCQQVQPLVSRLRQQKPVEGFRMQRGETLQREDMRTEHRQASAVQCIDVREVPCAERLHPDCSQACRTLP